MAQRKKTTVYIDSDLLRAAKIAAVREDKPDYLVFEDALRRHLGLDAIERVRSRSKLTEREATALAVRESRAVRREMTRERARPSRRRRA